MSKQSPLKRYIYISQRKIGMYDSQIPRHWWKSIPDWLLRISRIKAGPLEIDLPTQDLPSQHQKLQEIIRHLKQTHAIGTVDQPETYIHDTLDMFQVLVPPARPSRYRPGYPGFIYFGGGTETSS